jgi:ribosomal protein S18 acetylase RimI-like enzyme
MRDVTVRSLCPDDLEAAAELLAARHRAHRRAEPLLSQRFQDPGACLPELRNAWGPGASGAAAVRDGRLVGYLLGAPKENPVWGPNVWVENAGQALAHDLEGEVMRDLYGLAAGGWVEAGHTAHYVLVPAHDERLARAWFRLGFGQQHAHALRPPLTGPPPTAPGLQVRPARRDDIPVLARLDRELPLHQDRSPVFSAGSLPTLEESTAEWEEDIDDPDFTSFVAVHDGRVVGSAVGCSATKSGGNAGLIRPDHAGYLAFAAVLPEARGRGAGRLLGETVLHWAGEAGYEVVVTDWRVTNLLSSRAWPAIGFRETFLRLHRVVGY